MTRVIALTGRARAGKDTVAAMILDTYPGRAVRQGFADKLKVSAARALGLAGADGDLIALMDRMKTDGGLGVCIAQEIPIEHISGRQFLQWYGTEAHRDVFSDDFWIDAVLPVRDGALARDDADLIVIPDARFENEAERIRSVGGEIWRIERSAADGVFTHVSEAGLPAGVVTRTIANDGTLDDLRERVHDGLGLR